MRGIRAALAGGLLLALALAARAAPEAVPPPPALLLDGVPPVPAELEQRLKPYGEFRTHGLLSWHPTRREMLVRRRLTATSQVHRVAVPGTLPVPLTSLSQAVSHVSYQPTHGDYFVFAMAQNGNERFRLHRYDVKTGAITPLSGEGERVASLAWNRKGDRLAFTTVRVDPGHPERAAGTALQVIDPMRPASARVVARFEGAGWRSPRFSEDGRRVVLVEQVSATESSLWVLDVASGTKRRVSRPGDREPVAYRDAHFARDGRGLFATSDRDSEFRRLVYVPLGGGRERVLTTHLAYDVDDVEVSFEAQRIAFTTNERGSHVLRFLDLRTLKELPRPPLVDGVIGGLEWRRGSEEIGFHISSARAAGDVFSYDVKANRVTRWTNGNNPEVNTSEFAEPRIVRWLSFDGLEVSGLHYHPPKRFQGRRPVIVKLHGGPESQARPAFIGRSNYLVSELGIALILPNVRGSSGFGKTFLKLDDGPRREDAVKDVGALLDWIAQQPDLDANRVLLMGTSYGGWLALASAARYDARIAGTLSAFGISNLVTFLERTEGYRRDLRRAEYGDERDAATRAFLESISPLAQAERMTKPLFLVQGRNDPRVPAAQAEQLAATIKRRGTPVWLMVAADEGHGFARKDNADYLFYATVEFARRTLLP